MAAAYYARPHALVRAMLGRLLGPQQKQRLVTAESLEEALRQLRGTPYAAEVEAAAQAGNVLQEAERALERNLVQSYGRVIRTLSGPPQALIVEALRRLEVDNLKAILRGLATGAPAEEIRAVLVPLDRRGLLPLEQLLAAAGVAEAVQALDGLPYARPLAAALERYQREGSLFPLEVALDLDYLRRLWGRALALGGADRASARRALGSRYDVLNVTWLLRYKLIYRLLPQEIFNYTLPYGYRVDDETIHRAATAGDLAALVEALPQPYRGLLAPLVGAGIARMEVALRRYLWREALALLSGYPFQVGVILSYLYLKEAEVRDLVAILEGKSLGRPPAEIQAFLWSEL